jgi:hypothetical protein
VILIMLQLVTSPISPMAQARRSCGRALRG